MMKNRILLIDDDELVVKTIKRLLQTKGYEVETASSAKEAIGKARLEDFDLVISDIRMPGENGVAAVEGIQKLYEERNVYCGFMFISGYAEEDTPAHAVRLGITKFLFKPFDNEEFFKSISDELDLVRKERELKKIPSKSVSVSLKLKRIKAETKRAVITGIGVVAPNGIGKQAFWQGLREGRNCVEKITSFDVSDYPSQMAAEIKDFNPSDFIEDPHEIKRMARSSHIAVAAAKLALADAGLGSRDAADLPVIIGSSTSGVEYLLPEAYAFAKGGISKVRPYVGIAGFVGSISSEISRFCGARGLSHTISTGCTSSTDAMGYALRQIQYGFADAVITGGADACVNDGILAAFCRLGAVSGRNHEPKKASRPFNKDRDGFVIAEGGWIFILEELEHACKRKAHIYGELAAYGATCDAWHMSRPYPSGQYSIEAIQMALAEAHLMPEEVDVFEAYGNATKINDSHETGIVKKLFGKHAYKLLMPSVKSMLGHPIGAAGAAQVGAALQAINESFIHPTINYEVPDTECDLNYVPNQGQSGKFKVILCNSLAFGGKNAALIVRTFSQ